MKMILFGKNLKMSISLHFAYINSYIHAFICSVSISIDISKMNKFIENLAKLFNKATSFSCHKKNNAFVLDNPNPREHLPTIRILIFEEEVHYQSNMEREQAARIKEMEDEQ